MKKCFFRTFIILFSIFIIQGCIVKPPTDYHAVIDKPSLKEASFVIKPISADDITIVNVDDFLDDFPEIKTIEDGKLHFAEFINAKLFRKSRGMLITKTESFEKFIVDKVESVNLTVNENLKINLTVPVELNSAEAKADFILVIDDLVFSREVRFDSISMGNGMSGSVARNWLDLAFEFVVWDANNAKAVSYGRNSAKSSFSVYMDKSNWDDASSNILKEILPGSSFTNLKKR